MEIIYGNKFKELSGVWYMSWDELYAKKPRPTKPYVLVTHEGDGQINHDFDYILEDKNLIRWYAINVNIYHEKLTLIPCGIEYRINAPYGKVKEDFWTPMPSMLDVFIEVMNMKTVKDNDIYCNFAPHSWVEERQRCLKAMDKNGLKMADRKDYKEYLIDLKKSRFALCPLGNGIDTFRLWECFYLGVIPIMTKYINDAQIDLYNYHRYYYKKLPICWIDNWESFDKSKYNYEDFSNGNWDLKYIDMNYWRNKIENKER